MVRSKMKPHVKLSILLVVCLLLLLAQPCFSLVLVAHGDSPVGDGGWPLGQPTGVFMATSLLHYKLYPAAFPLWALGKVARAAGAGKHRS